MLIKQNEISLQKLKSHQSNTETPNKSLNSLLSGSGSDIQLYKYCPTIYDLSNMQQRSKLTALENISKLPENFQFSYNLGLTVFWLLLSLDPLLNNSELFILRILSRKLIAIRNSLSPYNPSSINTIDSSSQNSQKSSLIHQLNLLIFIIYSIFGQKDIY
ncbi:hypothetical protein AYI69_g4474 [Smittium culicis]|uniref:Uncharacterized protein n=1 Tax=Smittium culicis TaxID=133412 RepID=A0A1R1Y259_9FUNG|nr:hypothetical protein AYI69_g11296 [Smittium culicis]OMJ20915.1 hypothetical protein AYI69_g6037 [Smittium culicis]OMJ24913.1 hypothetical protein AYI69_g4474 [Smittium culicis]